MSNEDQTAVANKAKPALVHDDEEKLPTRDELRAKLFNTKDHFKSEMVTLFGARIEIRQPTLGVLMKAQQIEDRAKATVDMLIKFCFVPGTNERVFEIADQEGILNMPFGEDLLKASEAINRLTGVNVAEEEKNSGATPEGSMS